MKYAKLLLTVTLLTLQGAAHCDILGPNTAAAIAEQGLVVDLRDPEYKDGILSTEKGGVVRAADIRIQARKIRYITAEGQLRIEAEGDLIMEHGAWLFVAEKLEYDFITKKGTLYGARTAVDAWFVGGKMVELREDGSFKVTEAFISTCENVDSEWQINAREVTVKPDRTVAADSISIRFVKIPVFWFPSFKGSLRAFFDAPLRYRFSVGGTNRFLVSFRYRMFTLEHLHAYLRADYRGSRGPGIGLETEYRHPRHDSELLTRNYVARDGSVFEKSEHTRYRLEGNGRTRWGTDQRYSLHMRWDKLSDEDMPTDYQERDFDLGTAGRTELRLHRQDTNWLANLQGRARINTFQTVKQELPVLDLNVRPISIGKTGIVFDSRAEIGYLNFQFANDLKRAHNYSSFRTDVMPRLYRPITFGPCTLTPEAEMIGVYYGNGPDGDQWLLTGKLGASLRTHFYKTLPNGKALLTPYITAYHWPKPTSSANQHYIFDEDDGWAKLNHVEIGTDYQIFRDGTNNFSSRFWVDWFPDTPNFASEWHRVWALFTWNPYPTVRHTLETSYDIHSGLPGSANWMSAWTFTKDLAVAAEIRYRDKTTWRKSNPRRFMVDAFRPEEQLVHSALSDRRNTLLFHTFWRIDPSYALQIKTRHGWNRRIEPDYNEYYVALHMVLRCQWQMELSYTHREHDHRFGIYVFLREGAPKRPKSFLDSDTDYPVRAPDQIM